MNKLKTFWYSFKRSFVDVEYYQDILSARFSFSLKYLTLVIFAISSVQGIQMFIGAKIFTPKIPEFVKQTKNVLRNAYPAELEIIIANNELKTNVKEPYHIDILEIKKNLPEYDHFITIDTNAQVEDYASKSTLILLTKKSAVYPRSGNQEFMQYEVAPYERFKEQPIVMNRKAYLQFVEEVIPLMDKLPKVVEVFMWLALFLWPFVGTLFGLIGKLSYLLFASIVLWFVAKIFKNNLTYTEIYRLGMHGLTLPMVLTFLLSWFDVRFEYLFTAGFLLWMVIILSKIPVQKEKTMESVKELK